MASEMLPPGSVIGMLGGGQLGRMMALAAARLGLSVHVYCPDADSPAFEVAKAHTVAAYDDEAALAAFAARCDVVTYEFENMPARAAEVIAGKTLLRPGMYRNRHATGQHDHIGVAEPVRGGHKHLVAGVERGLHEIIEAVLAARADNNGFHRHRNAVVSFKIRARSLAQFGNSRHGGVAAKIVVNGRLGRLANMLGRGKIRLANGKAGDRNALSLELKGATVDTEGQRRFDIAQTVRNLHEGLLGVCNAPAIGRRTNKLAVFSSFTSGCK